MHKDLLVVSIKAVNASVLHTRTLFAHMNHISQKTFMWYKIDLCAKKHCVSSWLINCPSLGLRYFTWFLWTIVLKVFQAAWLEIYSLRRLSDYWGCPEYWGLFKAGFHCNLTPYWIVTGVAESTCTLYHKLANSGSVYLMFGWDTGRYSYDKIMKC